MAGLLMGLLQVILYCAIIIFIAFVILWLLNWIGIAVSGDVLKWGKIIVGLLCLIAIVGFLLSALGGASYSGPHFNWR